MKLVKQYVQVIKVLRSLFYEPHMVAFDTFLSIVASLQIAGNGEGRGTSYCREGRVRACPVARRWAPTVSSQIQPVERRPGRRMAWIWCRGGKGSRLLQGREAALAGKGSTINYTPEPTRQTRTAVNIQPAAGAGDSRTCRRLPGGVISLALL